MSIDPLAFTNCPLENISVHSENTYFQTDSKSIFSGENNSTLLRVVETFPESEYTVCNCVSSISDYCFFQCVNISSIRINSDITSIGKCVFKYCTSLTRVELSKKLTEIGDEAFYGCYKLTSLTISENAASPNFKKLQQNENLNIIDITVTRISYKIFAYCSSLTNIEIGQSITEIGDEAFCECKSLSSITIQGNDMRFGNSVFQLCISLINIIIKGKIVEIGFAAFYFCESIKSIIIKGNISIINAYTFCNCFSLEYISLPENVICIYMVAFSSCISLTNFIFPKQLTTVELDAFFNCTSLTRITFPENVKVIGAGVFRSCTNLKSITFDSNSNNISIDGNPFYMISDQVNIFIPGTFNISRTYPGIFPEKSHLYITNKTILLDLSKTLFGEKTMIVHYVDMTRISDEKTDDVIRYIALEIKYPKTMQNVAYDKSKYLFVMNVLISVYRRNKF